MRLIISVFIVLITCHYSLGNVYIADLGNGRIRKVAASTGIITTIAGTGTCCFIGDGGAATSATLYSVYGVGVDSSGTCERI